VDTAATAAAATTAPAAAHLELACESCGALLTVDPAHRTATCPYCASPSVVDRPATHEVDPTFAITFTAGDALAKRAFAAWLAGRSWFCDSALRHASISDLRGVYVPAYLYSAVTRSTYSAEIGENYTEVQRVGKHTRVVTKTEYRELAGQHVAYATDVLVTASKGLPNAELEAVEPFDMRQLRRYEPALVSGWIAEIPSRTAAECTTLAREETVAQVGRKLTAFMPGDSHRALTYQTTVEWESLDPVLVPLWVMAVRYRPDKPPVRLVVNGQTGKASGKAPIAAWKVVLAVLLGLAVLGGGFYAFYKSTSRSHSSSYGGSY
jgi:hypothetical protein